MVNNTVILLNRLKISSKNKNSVVVVPSSSLNRDILIALSRKGLISYFILSENRTSFKIFLKIGFSQNLFDRLNIISTSSRPVFLSAKHLKKKYRPYDFFVVLSSKGVFLSDEVFFNNVGGELLCDTTQYN